MHVYMGDTVPYRQNLSLPMVLKMLFGAQTAKVNDCQYFRLYSIISPISVNTLIIILRQKQF